MATVTRKLTHINIRWLRQALALVERISDESYATTPAGFAPHRAGGHLRHILEFYRCFLEGLDTRHIDYDARHRDRAVETSRAAAASAIQSIIRDLDSSTQLRCDEVLWVREEDGDTFLESSLARELQSLSSHTIHHFALLALMLRLHGVDVDPNFGMAPSTLRYQQTLNAEAA